MFVSAFVWDAVNMLGLCVATLGVCPNRVRSACVWQAVCVKRRVCQEACVCKCVVASA